MGGIHAIEHALIGVFPLIVMADRNDLGGISTTFHSQLRHSAIFVYDGVPGGAGISRQAFERVEELFDVALDLVSACSCENGCPSCVHSPKCGSGNRPIDKHAAAFILRKIRTNDDHNVIEQYDSGVKTDDLLALYPKQSEGQNDDYKQKEQKL